MKNSFLFKNYQFSKLWFSQIISQAGNRMFQLATLWWLIGQFPQKSGMLVAIFMIFAALPSILFVKWIGNTIDGNSTKKILLRSDFSGLLYAIILAFSFHFKLLPIGFLMMASIVFSLCQSFIEPSLNKIIPELLDKEDLDKGISFMSSTVTIANFGGALLGALLIEKMGILMIVLLNGLSYALSAAVDNSLKYNNENVIAPKEKESKAESIVLSGLLKKVLFGFAAVNFFGSPVLIILPLYTNKVLEANASALAFLESCIWIGLIVGTFVPNYLKIKLNNMKLVSFCLMFYALFLLIPYLVVNINLYGFSLFGIGLSLGLINVKMVSWFHQVIEQDFKGRFFAVLQATISSCVPISYFVFGFLADFVPIIYLCLIQALGVACLVPLFFGLCHHKETQISPYREASHEI